MKGIKGQLTKRRSKEWRMSVLLSLLIALILSVSFIVLFRQINSISNTSYHLVENQAESVSSQIANLFNNYYKMGTILGVSQKVIEYADYEDSSSEPRVQAAYSLSKELLQLLNVYGESINNIAVYFPASDSVITMSRQLYSDSKHFFFDDEPSLSPERLEELLQESYRGYTLLHDGSKNWLIQKTTTTGGNSVYIMIEYNLKEAVRQITSRTEGILVLVGNDEELIYSNGTEESELDFQAALRNAASGTLVLDREYITRYKETDYGKISIIVGIPSRVLVNIRHQLNFLMAFTSIIVAGCLVVLLYNLRSRVFLPIEALASSRRKESLDTKDALAAISKDLVSIEDNRDQLLRERSYMVPFTMGRLIYRIILAPEDHQNLNRASSCLSMAGIPQGESFAAFSLALVEDVDSIFSGQTLEGHGFSRMHFFLDNVLRDLLFEQYPGYVVPVGTSHYEVIVQCPATALETVRNACQQLLRFYEEHFSVIFTATDVDMGTGPQEFIDIAIKEAKEVSLRSFWGEDTAHGAENDSDSGAFYTTCNMIRRLISELTLDNYEKIWTNLDTLLSKALPASEQDLKKIRYRMYAMTAILITAIEEQLGGDRELIETHSFDARLYEAGSIGDYRKELKAILAEVVEYKDTQEKNAFVSGRMEDVRQYLLEHYTENSISVAGVAEEFGISISYLSRSFKEAFGINLLEYIQRLRITQAKKLLKSETVQNVAKEVGFWDTQALTRVFKKYEGMAPADYKRLLDQEREWK